MCPSNDPDQNIPGINSSSNWALKCYNKYGFLTD